MERTKRVMDFLTQDGHVIVYDWVAKFDEGPTKQKAIDEAEAIRSADLLVYLWAKDQESARYEAGMAMGLEKPVIVSGKSDAFFFQLPNVHCVNSDNEIVSKAKELL